LVWSDWVRRDQQVRVFGAGGLRRSGSGVAGDGAQVEASWSGASRTASVSTTVISLASERAFGAEEPTTRREMDVLHDGI